MSDSVRTSDSRALDVGSDADRDAKIEQLLVAGLDHYFAARYEQAINVWTRALFFDRGHPRARAYIDRARSALAERLRESEELLQKGLAAFENGERDEAQRLLQAAIDGGAPSDEAQTLLDRLHRDRQPAAPGAISDREPPPASITQPSSSSRTKAASPSREAMSRANFQVLAGVAGIAVGAVVVGTYIIVSRDGLSLPAIPTQQEAPVNSGAAPATRDTALPLPRRGDMAVHRARLLAADGRLHEALAALDSVRPTDPQKPEADRVRADLQHQLLERASIPRSESPDRGK